MSSRSARTCSSSSMFGSRPSPWTIRSRFCQSRAQRVSTAWAWRRQIDAVQGTNLLAGLVQLGRCLHPLGLLNAVLESVEQVPVCWEVLDEGLPVSKALQRFRRAAGEEGLLPLLPRRFCPLRLPVHVAKEYRRSRHDGGPQAKQRQGVGAATVPAPPAFLGATIGHPTQR